MKTKVKKTKKPRKQPKTKANKQMKDKSVKQNVNVNVTSSGGGGSGGSSIPSAQPYQMPILSQFKQSEKVGENVDIKNLTEALKNFGVGLNQKTSNYKAPLFESDELPTEIQIKRNPITNNNTLIDNLNNANKPKILKQSEEINNPDELEFEEEINNPLVRRIEGYENFGMGQEDILSQQFEKEENARIKREKRAIKKQMEEERKRVEEETARILEETKQFNEQQKKASAEKKNKSTKGLS